MVTSKPQVFIDRYEDQLHNIKNLKMVAGPNS